MQKNEKEALLDPQGLPFFVFKAGRTCLYIYLAKLPSISTSPSSFTENKVMFNYLIVTPLVLRKRSVNQTRADQIYVAHCPLVPLS